MIPARSLRKSAELTSTQLERFYRSQILSGELAAGTRLPSNKELARQWESSTMAVQRALSNLAAEGLIDRRQRRGTFVCNSSEKACIGILVGPDLVNTSTPFFRRLVSAICDQLSSLYLTPRVYDGLTFFKEREISYSHGNLIADQRSYRFRGYILIGTSNVDEAVFDCGTAARAVIMDVKRGSDLMIDYGQFVRDSITQLALLNERKVVYVRAVPEEKAAEPVRELDQIVRKLDLPKPKIWNVAQTPYGDQGEFEDMADLEINRYFGKLSGKALKAKLPDVFMVADDILARPIILNLLKRGISIPDDVRFCILSNTDYSIYYGVPVYRYEINMHEIASSLCSRLNARLAGEKSDGPVQLIGGVFKAKRSRNQA